MVCPECYPHDFLKFLDVVHIVEEGLLVDHDLQGYIQVVPFHPLFRFGNGKDNDDDDDLDNTTADDNIDVKENDNGDTIDNWTNRSPYPTFHILREADVSKP